MTHSPTPSFPLRLLFLAANPRGMDQARLMREAALVQERLNEHAPGEIQFIPALAVKPEDLSFLLLKHRPHLVHFAAHGSSAGELLLEDAQGEMALLPPERLGELFRLLGGEVRGVLINACWSLAQAEALVRYVPAVIGMREEISDAGALAFAAGFYRGVSFHQPLQIAFDLGRHELALVEAPARDIPCLLTGPEVDAMSWQVRGEVETGLLPEMTASITRYLAGLRATFAELAAQYVDLAGTQQARLGWEGFAGVLDPVALLAEAEGVVVLDGWYYPREGAERQAVENVRETLRSIQRGVLLGEPGSGKTWTLWRLALDYAAAWEGQGGNREMPRLPLLVRLNRFRGEQDGRPLTFANFVQGEVAALEPKLGQHLAELIARGQVVFLCDALNEMPRQAPDGRDLVAEVRAYLRLMSAFVVACRVRDYQEELRDLYPLEQVYLRDLTPPQIKEVMVRRLGAKAGASLWQAIGGSEDLLGFWQRVVEQGEESHFWEVEHEWPSELYHGIWPWHRDWRRLPPEGMGHRDWRRSQREGARLIPMCRNPFLSHLLCWVYREAKGQLPKSRAELFKVFIQKLLGREALYAAQRGEIWSDQVQIERVLVAVARAMQEAAGTVVPWTTVLEAVGGAVHGRLLEAAIAANLLVEEGEQVRFSHQLLQEYFAARTMLEALEAGENPARFFGAEWWDAGVWRETTVILGEFIGEGARGPNYVAQWLAPMSPEVALQVLLRNGEGLTVADLEPETRALLMTSAQAKSSEPDPRGRAAAYRVLALLDADNRPGVGLGADRLPDIEWVEIPGGRCWIGGDEKAYNSLPALEVDIPTFWLAKYPITNWQWEAFVVAGGYETDKWWAGLEKPKPAAPEWSYGNHPRETVDWYEAVAFCRWLSAQLGDEVRLPTEAEWEKAARGIEEGGYPWGDEYINGSANIDETERVGHETAGPYFLSQTSAVGIYPQDISAHGVRDLSGNVFEWTISIDGEKHSSVRRGGAWNNDHETARRASRIPSHPDSRNDHGGVRVACSAPPASRWDTDRGLVAEPPNSNRR